MGHGRKPRSPDTCQIKPTDRHQALAADFFDSIGQIRTQPDSSVNVGFGPKTGRKLAIDPCGSGFYEVATCHKRTSRDNHRECDAPKVA